MELKYLAGKTGTLRTATFKGRDHFVVPVTALMEGVIHAVNAAEPEFVPLMTLARAPQGWNGRPTVLGHPTNNGVQISANDPKVLEASAFGEVFNTRIEGKQLVCEAWIDPKKVQKIGAQKMLERLQAGETIEVSVGAFVSTRSAEGNHNGRAYKTEWADLMPDHLAFLPESTGACSVKMGCGARAAEAAKEEPVEEQEVIEPRSLKERLAALVPWLRDAAMSHQDLNSKLSKALKASVPGYSYIEYVYLDNTVVYSVRSGYDGAVSVDVAPSSSNLFRRSFMVETDGSVTLGDDVEAVEIVMSVEPKTAEAPVTEAAPAADNPAALEGGKEEQMEPTPEKAALIKALVECPCSGFTSDDAKALEAFSDERLLAFKAAGAARKAQEDAAKTPKTLEQYLADAPDEIRTLVADKKAQDAVRTASLVTALKAAQTEYTEEELTKMDIKTLERLSKIVKTEPAPDFSGRGLAAQDNADKSTYAAPDSYQASLQKK